ncbi:hypothetical protein, partial [Crocosphaera watsonii]|uniref:hypothetical protein n=1 Tax=Crocosphaera watsonii TaxID=263511 RepID=UPI00065F6BCE
PYKSKVGLVLWRQRAMIRKTLEKNETVRQLSGTWKPQLKHEASRGTSLDYLSISIKLLPHLT